MANTLDVLEQVYKVINIVILAFMLFLTLFLIGYKLRLRLEKPALVILFTQLIVMTARIFQTQDQSIA